MKVDTVTLVNCMEVPRKLQIEIIELSNDSAILLLGMHLEKTLFEKIHMGQYYLQQPRYKSNLFVHKQAYG